MKSSLLRDALAPVRTSSPHIQAEAQLFSAGWQEFRRAFLMDKAGTGVSRPSSTDTNDFPCLPPGRTRQKITQTMPRANPKGSCELWVIKMYSCRLILGKKCTTLVSNIGNGVGYACVEKRRCGKSLYLPLNFVVNL